VINLDRITLRRGGHLLFDQASLSIFAGQHLGICGANGTGKTSLFHLLSGELSIDSGDIHVPDRSGFSHMVQESELVTSAAIEYVIDGDKQLRQIQKELAIAETGGEHQEISRLHDQLDARDGYNAHYRAGQLLHGLGFSNEECLRPACEFSGGWRRRLGLARVLMCPGDILLLDEPTNHLDLDATIWLQRWLERFQGTLLLISHDRDFLDIVADHILHIEQRQLFLYKGNYSAFELQRAERLAQQQAFFEKQQQRRTEIQAFVRRFRAKASKARQAQSRLKELNRMQEIAAAHVDSPFRFRIPEAPKMSDPLLLLDNASVAYAEQVILKNVRMGIHPGSRIGLLGANGAGKSTLIKALTAALPLYKGKRVAGEHLRIGYFAQHQLEALDLDASPLLHIQRLNAEATEQSIRNFLGGFNFHGDRTTESVRPFSGGEKARLALAVITWQRPNLLLLDEPTNHLDLEMRHALTVALQEFNGAIIVVSHDRHLLRNCVDEFWLISGGEVNIYDGDLNDYQRRLSLQVNEDLDKDARNPRVQRQQSAARRLQASPLRKQLQRFEQELSADQQTLRDIESRLADNSLYQDQNKQQLKELLGKQAEARKRMQECEEKWLQLQEQLESINS